MGNNLSTPTIKGRDLEFSDNQELVLYLATPPHLNIDAFANSLNPSNFYFSELPRLGEFGRLLTQGYKGLIIKPENGNYFFGRTMDSDLVFIPEMGKSFYNLPEEEYFELNVSRPNIFLENISDFNFQRVSRNLEETSFEDLPKDQKIEIYPYDFLRITDHLNQDVLLILRLPTDILK